MKSAIKFLALVLLLSGTQLLRAQTLNPNWQTDLEKSVESFKSCEQKMDDGINACSKFVGESVKTVYNINDFYSDELGRYMIMSEIDEFVKESGKWEELGYAYDQKALNKAQENANKKIATIAIYLGSDGLGNLALIVPGDLVKSGSWGFEVPNSATFFMNSPDRSYANKSLSFAYGRGLIKNVILYSRKY